MANIVRAFLCFVLTTIRCRAVMAINGHMPAMPVSKKGIAMSSAGKVCKAGCFLLKENRVPAFDWDCFYPCWLFAAYSLMSQQD